ncbi:helix-turn-helix domain-containing protein [Hymenobacter terrenus]|uniref:hypothetical protein n=1 Tax=Hymenobacter terrenus TaxID=1629124 RepID=UPI0006195A31|nr:hypothetical protein [Hymenobacter terrenus]
MPPAPSLLPFQASLWQEVQAYFGLSQAALGRILGLRPPMMNHVVTGRRQLPLATAPIWTRLVLAIGTNPTEQEPAPLAEQSAPIAELASVFGAAHPLVRHGLGCMAAAQRLAGELATAQTRAAWAERRLAALAQLATPLLPTEAPGPPPWLAQFESEARVTLAEFGPLVQARLAVRRAGLLYEAEAVRRLLSGTELYDLVEEVMVTTLTQLFTPIPTVPLMVFSVDRFKTQAECQRYLDKKLPERTLLAAHLSMVETELATWDQKGDPAADQATAQDLLDKLTPVQDATSDAREKLRLNRLLNFYRTRVTNLEGRTITHGTDELLDREQDRDDTINSLAVLDALIQAVTDHRDVLLS